MAREHPSSCRCEPLFVIGAVVMSAWWILIIVIFVVLPVAMRFVDEHPRNDEPPDTGGGERDLGPAAVPVAA